MGTQPPNAEPVHFEPKDRPLRHDVGRLGELLGELLRELAPAGVYDTVERARLVSRRRRRGDPAAGDELEELVGALDPATAYEVVRAFSAYFGVVNTAEQVHRLRRRIDRRREGIAQTGSLRAVAHELARRGTSADEVAEALNRITVEPVFTAHPTEAVRRTLLKKDQRLAKALVERFLGDALDPDALRRIDERITLEIASAWQTDEQLERRPTVAEEVEHMLFFLSDVLYRVVPTLHEELARALEEAYGRPIPVPRPLVRFASWVGGDMDGNPNVGADTIRATLDRHVGMALRRYREELHGLHEHLSQSVSRTGFSDALAARLTEYERLVPTAFERVPQGYRTTPYRLLLWAMDARLTAKERGEAGGYGPPEEFERDLELIEVSLAANHGSRAGSALVRRALVRARVFGFHLAALDVRQDAEVHRRVVGELLDDAHFGERDGTERTAAISRALRTGVSPRDGLTGEAASTVEVFRAIGEGMQRHGRRAFGLFVVSMAQGPDDALAVLLLARAGGLVDERGEVPLDVAPLFETVDALEAGPDVLRALCEDEVYARHLASRGGRQVVMLGYSDSNKDGGIAASRVGLVRAQERLVATALEHGIELVFFHGRGGSISRGGSKPRAAILAEPPGALQGTARATEQGEIVGAKYGVRGIAMRSLELALGALLERTAGGDPTRPGSKVERAIAETLAKASRASYRALVHDEPDFAALFQNMTPIDVIERLEIGSRPARRREMRGVRDLRAIPWVFAWTQCRAVLPGWYGVGSGLAAAIDEHGLETVRAAARDWPFLATFVADVEMVLAKSDLDIAGRYAELAGEVGARLFPLLAAEHERSVAVVLEVTGSHALLDRDPTLQRSIRLRNPYVDPMSFVQVELLRRWRAGGREDRELERVLVQTVRGIARGLRNTG